MNDGWEQREPGWYTHAGYRAGITRENDGKWWCWTKSLARGDGPFRTLQLAKDWVRVNAQISTGESNE